MEGMVKLAGGEWSWIFDIEKTDSSKRKKQEESGENDDERRRIRLQYTWKGYGLGAGG